MFYFRSDPARSFDTLDEALESAEADDLTVAIVVDDVGDILVKRWHGGRLEYPVGTFSPEESASLSLLRHKVA